MSDRLFRIKRVYDAAAADDGTRFLIDRLWPRGIARDALALTDWLPAVAPSAGLRRGYHNHAVLWSDFQQRYWSELQAQPDTWQPLLDASAAGPVTLLYASRDAKHNHAIALRAFLGARLRARADTALSSPTCYASIAAEPAVAPLEKGQLETLADFRYQLRRFLRFSEELVHAYGITPQQYQLLLQIKGYPQRDWATVGELAERLQAKHHGVVSLVSRCEKIGLVRRQPSLHDRRCVEVHLSPAGERCLDELARQHWEQLQSLHGNWIRPVPAGAD